MLLLQKAKFPSLQVLRLYVFLTVARGGRRQGREVPKDEAKRNSTGLRERVFLLIIEAQADEDFEEAGQSEH